MIRAAFILAPAVLLAACESMPGNPVPRGIAAYEGDVRLGERTDRICFASSIDGFSANKDRTVVLRDGRKEYLVEVYGACPELDFAQSIGIEARTGCLTRSDALIVSSSLTGSGAGTGPNRCMIKEIYTWDSRAKAEPAEAEEETGSETAE
ncbi:MAG: DUF6491 family protein [Hyphomonas sp.]